MEIFTCDNCKQLLYFENSTCLNCSHTVGFDVVQFDLLTLNKDGDVWLPVNNKKESLRFCANTVHGTCNWLIPVDQVSPFCPACTLNRTIPTLSSIDNQQKWRRIEIAKHRLVYSLFRLGLPVNAKKNVDDIEGIAFDFMEDVSADEKIMTGHDNGVITLNIDEADEGERIRHKLDLGKNTALYWGIFATKLDIIIGKYSLKIVVNCKNSDSFLAMSNRIMVKHWILIIKQQLQPTGMIILSVLMLPHIPGKIGPKAGRTICI
jgi:hypothetical protein